MMEESTKDLLAILGIFLGVEDMLMPEFVDRPRRNDVPLRIEEIEKEEVFVLDFHFLCLLARPALAILRVTELESHTFEIKLIDRCLSLFHDITPFLFKIWRTISDNKQFLLFVKFLLMIRNSVCYNE